MWWFLVTVASRARVRLVTVLANYATTKDVPETFGGGESFLAKLFLLKIFLVTQGGVWVFLKVTHHPRETAITVVIFWGNG